MSKIVEPLLDKRDPQPVETHLMSGRSVFVLTADHAGRAIPACLGTLGLAAEDLNRHIAWDIGIGAVARLVSEIMDAPLVLQRYSRLVIDCNRDPEVPSSIPTLSEYTRIAANESLTAEDRRQRRDEIFAPYHSAISEILARRMSVGAPTVVVALHSMTPVFKGASRPMHAAVLYDRDARFAHCVLQRMRREAGLFVADNEPYFVSPETDYTIPHHAEGRFPYAEVEIRQDLIEDEEGQRQWAERIGRVLTEAYETFAP